MASLTNENSTYAPLPLEKLRNYCSRSNNICDIAFQHCHPLLVLVVENLAYMKDSWVNKRHLKRHVRNQWIRGQAGRAVDGQADQALSNCTTLDNFHVDRPTWMVDLGQKVKVSGVIIQTWIGNETGRSWPYR